MSLADNALRALPRVALAVLVVLATACNRVSEPASVERASAAVQLPNSGAGQPSSCSLSAWVDLGLARKDPTLGAAREQLLGSPGGARLELARAAGIDLENEAKSVSLCEFGGKGDGRVFVFEADFQPDLLDRVAKAAPKARREDTPYGPVVNVGSSWLGRSPAGLVWADARTSLERALGGALPKLNLDRGGLLTMRLSGGRAATSLAGLAKAAGADPAAFESVVLSLAKDGQSTELRVVTRSSDTATSMLTGLQGAFKDVRENVNTNRLPGADRVSVEADGAQVIVRSRSSLQGFLALLVQLGKKPERSHHVHP